jgi:hypothetical protein
MDFRDQVDHKAIAQFTAGPGAPPPAQAEAEEIPVEEGEEPPAHGVLGARVEQLDKKKARGIPIIQPPPGFVYAPDLAAFVPDPSQPGWMTMLQAEAAQSNKGYYDQGQHDLLAGQAQANVDQQVDQQNMAAQQQAEAEQQQGMQQQAMQQKAEQGAMNLTIGATQKEEEQAEREEGRQGKHPHQHRKVIHFSGGSHVKALRVGLLQSQRPVGPPRRSIHERCLHARCRRPPTAVDGLGRGCRERRFQ